MVTLSGAGHVHLGRLSVTISLHYLSRVLLMTGRKSLPELFTTRRMVMLKLGHGLRATWFVSRVRVVRCFTPSLSKWRLEATRCDWTQQGDGAMTLAVS